MAPDRFYVVYRGRVPGVYLDWASCHEQVNGFPSNMYRRLDTLTEAIDSYTDFVLGQRQLDGERRRWSGRASDQSGSLLTTTQGRSNVGRVADEVLNVTATTTTTTTLAVPEANVAEVFIVGFVMGVLCVFNRSAAEGNEN